MEKLIEWDQNLLLELHHLGSPAWDGFWLFITTTQYWATAFFVIALLMGFKTKSWWHTIQIALTLAVLATAAYLLVEEVVKPLVERLRPCNEIDVVRHLRTIIGRHCSIEYSFFSGHATNSFAQASFLALVARSINRWLALPIIALAFLISYSRIYLGVHYPIDVITGALVGMGMGYLFYFLLNNWIQRSVKHA